MTIDVYGRKGCTFCKAAKEKLDIMGLDYKMLEFERFVEFHEGWREDGSVELMAAYAMFDHRLPVIRVDGKYLDYSGAMKRIKSAKRAGTSIAVAENS